MYLHVSRLFLLKYFKLYKNKTSDTFRSNRLVHIVTYFPQDMLIRTVMA